MAILEARVTNSLTRIEIYSRDTLIAYIIILHLPVLSNDDTAFINHDRPLKILFSSMSISPSLSLDSSLIASILIALRHSVIAEQIALWLAAVPTFFIRRNLMSNTPRTPPRISGKIPPLYIPKRWPDSDRPWKCKRFAISWRHRRITSI